MVQQLLMNHPVEAGAGGTAVALARLILGWEPFTSLFGNFVVSGDLGLEWTEWTHARYSGSRSNLQDSGLKPYMPQGSFSPHSAGSLDRSESAQLPTAERDGSEGSG